LPTIKYIHIVCAVISMTGFIIRGVWMLAESPTLQRRWVRVAPHVVDTILLMSAIILAVNIQQYPGTHDWLTAKVIALLAYVVLGSIGLKRGRTRPVRTTAWIAALLVFGYIVGVAVTRSVALGIA
jgi:uncharacterized membrane protein SirB2